ncbi:MAG: alkaline shock response membrane anchor protein AmaP [Clostridia bacterium]|nr:alkaline shock response membrane anchor protein AmaP [Clostridia bacterium]
MKIIDKIALIVFSVIMLVISIIYVLVYFNVMDYELFLNGINSIFQNNPGKSIVLAVAIISIILSLKAILFEGDYEKKVKSMIQIKSEIGLLQIMPNTIENIAMIALSNYTNISDVATKMQSKDDGIVINVSLSVLPDTNITELVEELQSVVKEKIETQTSAKVIEVNIIIKNVNKNKTIKEEIL